MNKPTLKKIVPVVLLLLVGTGVWQWRHQDGQETLFRTAPVSRGNLLVTISATGTVEPEEVIDVGAQVAGRILVFGKDANGKTVDYGSPVEAGTVLARIDDSLYAADVDQAEAQLLSAKANLQKAQADLQRAEQDWKRAQKLGPSEALSQASYDTYKSNYKIAQAQLGVSKAAIRQAEANLSRAQRNLGYCTIKSPVKGVIIDRRVNIGQTVVASLNAPSLFLIAKDLTRIQVWVAVNEADIGRIHPDQPVQFTVDAFPGEIFHGEVGKIRLNASMTQNVVTYTVEIRTDNSNGRLLPYLTANVKFELERVNKALLVPNAALRWKPTDNRQIAPADREAFEKTDGRGQKVGKAEGVGTLWLPEGPYVRPLMVQVGPSDGRRTAVSGEGVSKGMLVVTGEQSPEEAARNENDGGRSPFTPSFRHGRGNRSRSR
jgi:HlyD family secretion protein